MKTLFSRIRLRPRQLACLAELVLISAVGQMTLPALLSEMIGNGVSLGSRRAVWALAAIMAAVTLTSCAVNLASVRIAADVSTDFASRLRGELFASVQRLSSAELDRFGTASLVTRSTSDVVNVQNFLSMLLRIGLLAPMMAAAGLAFSAATGGKLSSVLLVAAPLLIVALSAVAMLAARHSVRLRKKLDALNGLFLESLEGVRVIRAFNRQDASRARFESANAAYAQTAIAAGRVGALLLPLINAIFGVTTAAVLGLGAVYVSRGEMDAAALVANSQYISMVLTSVIMLSLVIMMFPTSYACAGRIAEVLEAQPGVAGGDYPFERRPLRGALEFRHVTFAYPGADEPILKDVSFEARPGEVVAIIGGTGRGKSSILKLIPRLYDPLFGEILIDGVNIREYRLEDLRSLIGYVPQKSALFSGDVASNLNLGRADGGEADWARAARIACAEEFIEARPERYHAPIAQGGANLSDGQRQRVAIARALMKRAEIYVFDDSFSALDPKTERRLRENLRAQTNGATIVMVAQRIGSIMDADRILVVDDGRIVAQGTHAELLKSCALYREIAQIQLGKEAV